MSYCVNCGVELDKTCGICPLCHTPVHNPNQPIDTTGPKPFPLQKGIEEPVERREYTILFTIILAVTAIVCRLINIFVFSGGNWSIYVSGFCAMLWIFLLPFFFPDKIRTSVSLLLDGLSIAAYLYLVSRLHPGNGWYVHIALPITAVATLFVIVLYVFTLRRRSSFIMRTALLIENIAVLCVTIELLVDFHYQNTLALSWSAVVLACCVTIDIILITISHLKGVRGEFRRRMHF